MIVVCLSTRKRLFLIKKWSNETGGKYDSLCYVKVVDVSLQITACKMKEDIQDHGQYVFSDVQDASR